MLSKAKGFLNLSRSKSKSNKELPANLLAPVGFLPEEVTLLTSMLAIVAIRSETQWELATIDRAKVFICNADSNEGASFIRRYGHIVPVITYSKQSDVKDSMHLLKPLRARGLMQALESVAPVQSHNYEQAQQWDLRRA